MPRTNFVRLALYTITLFLFTHKNLLAQRTFENVDPTVSQFEIIRGSGDPDYTGALNFKIPLMKVPGRGGLDYDLELAYVHGSGVPASESASWVGLGWNLNMYQISCSPAYAPDGADAISSTGKDVYHLSYPGGSTTIYQFADGWRPLDWSAIKIDAVTESNYSTSGWALVEKDFNKFTITDSDGKRYVFADRLRQESSKPLTNHCCLLPSCSPHSHSLGYHPYFYVFKLSAILGADYVDVNSNDIPDASDLGSWIKLVYSAPQTISGGISPDFYKIEINYLSQIITPTHTATFNRSAGGNYFIYAGKENGDQLDILNNIELSPGGIKVEFFTSSKFGWVMQYVAGGYFLVNQDGYTIGIGFHYFRIGLDSLRTSGGSGSERTPPYKFEYTGNPTEAHLSPVGVDPWGFYTLNSNYTHPTEAQVKWTVWLLKKVTYPTSGTVEFEYETNRFQTYHGNFRGSFGDTEVIAGGVRLKKQTITDPLTQQASVYQYKYALTNKRHPEGYGFLSSEPMTFGYTIPTQNSVGKNLRTEVHYPDVEITRPDGSKVRKYYTAALSGVNGDPPTGQSYNPYINYRYSYWTVTMQNDIDLQNTQVCCGNQIYTIFDCSYATPCPDDETCQYFDNPDCYVNYLPPNNTPKDAFLGEASELDDNTQNLHSGCGVYIQVPLFSNGWKRGRLTYEEFYQAPSGNPALDTTAMHVTTYFYKMLPIKSEQYIVKIDYSCGPTGSSTTPAFVTSGWAQLTRVETRTRMDPLYALALVKLEDYEYNTTNGLIKKKTETNTDGTQRITKFKYPVDYTNTTGAGDVYEQALHAMRTTKHIYSPVIEKETRELPPGQSEKLVAAELVKYKQFGTSGQYFPHEIKRFSHTTSVTDFVGSNITSGTFTSDSRYQLQNKNEQYDSHGNLALTYDANNIPASLLWAYNNTLLIGQARNATPAQAITSIFDDNSAAGWSSGSGTWIVGSGFYQQDDDGARAWNTPQRYNSVSLDDGILEADIRFDDLTTPRYAGLAKYVSGSFVRFELRRLASSSNVRIYVTNITDTVTALKTIKSFNPGVWYHLRGEIQGNTAKLYLDGELLLALTNNLVDLGAGVIGLCTYETRASFDNVRYYPFNALALSRSFDPGLFTVNTRTDENGMSRRFTFDALGRLKTVQDALGNLAQNINYYYAAPITTTNANYIKTTLATNAALHVRNHDFEKATGAAPSYWTGQTFGSGCTAAWDSTVSYSGKKSLKANIPSPSAANRVLWSATYDEKVSTKETYRMEAWVKTSANYNNLAAFTLLVHDAAHNPLAAETRKIYLPNTAELWQKVTLDFTPGSNADHVYAIHLDFEANGVGTIWYDRVNFYELNTTKTFADGLGRSVQTLQFQGSNSSVQTATVYDNLSRVSKVTKVFLSADTLFTTAYNASAQPPLDKYPPIDSANTWYTDPNNKHMVYNAPPEYDIDKDAFAETAYYNDPLDRVYKQAAPGTVFKMSSGREVKFHYSTNTMTTEVPGYGVYTLMKQRQTNENGQFVNTYTDNFGNSVATIVDSADLNLTTTFKYDVLGNLIESKDPRGLATIYAYNTQSRLRQKISPDAGTTEYLYDPNGNLRFVKDATGAAGNAYFIYYKYDNFNRKIEEGTKTNPSAYFNQAKADSAAFPVGGHTVKVKYQHDVTTGYTIIANNLRGRLYAIEYTSDRYPAAKGFIFYSYDANGNIEASEQFIPKGNVTDGANYIATKIEYQYDALGKVTKIYYRRTFPPGASSDAFYTWYDYDALGRLEKVFTNTSDLKSDPPHAQYIYWPGGQVKRLVLGGTVQGLDYLYNSRDWLTQINYQNLGPANDPGGDDKNTNGVNADKFGQIIGYNKQWHIANGHPDFTAQYNGNIAWTIHNTSGNKKPAAVNVSLTGWVYKYDKTNRLTKADWGYYSGGWQNSNTRYDLANILYDRNGNLEYMTRYDTVGVATDMDYFYQANTNKLNFIGGLNGQANGNYVFDNNGNMIKDAVKLGAGSTMTYDYRNLPTKIPKSTTPSGTLDFGYDGKGQRVSKNNLFYVYGADGRLLVVYDVNGTHLYWNVWGLDLIGQRFWKE